MRSLTHVDRELIRQVALQFVDMPFNLTGDGEHSFNCSQFVAKVYRLALDIVLPQKSDWLFLKSKIIPSSELQIGDLVFYCREPRPYGRLATHVAIYIGDNQIINARQGAGGVVIESITAPKKHQILQIKDPAVCEAWLKEILSI
jgi:cell wall-associated NlpC family hydrolase